MIIRISVCYDLEYAVLGLGNGNVIFYEAKSFMSYSCPNYQMNWIVRHYALSNSE